MSRESPKIYHKCTPVVEVKCEFESDTSPTETVVEALAEAAETDPLDLPPLYESIDPDALDRLFRESDGVNNPTALLSFQVGTWHVFVRADGRIRVCDNTRLTDPKPVFESPLA